MIKLERVTAYTIIEASDMLKLSRATLYDLIKTGKLAAQKIGNKWYITDRTIEEHVTGGKKASSVVSESER